MSRLGKIFPYIAHQWRWLVAILLLTIVSSAAMLTALADEAAGRLCIGRCCAPDAIAGALNALGVAAGPQAMVILAALASLLLFAVTSALSVGLSLSWNMGGQRMVYDVAGDLFARLQRLSMSFHNRRSVGDSLSRLTEDTWCVYTVADGLLMAPIQQIVTLAMMIWIGFALDPVLAILALAVAPALALSSRFFGNRLKQRSRLGREAKSRLMSFVHQTLCAIPLVQTYATESREYRQVSGSRRGGRRTLRSAATCSEACTVWSTDSFRLPAWQRCSTSAAWRSSVGRHPAGHAAGIPCLRAADAERVGRPFQGLCTAQDR